MNQILLVDDDASHRMSLRGLLEEEGFLCTEVEDGQQALEKLASDSFSLVMTDLKRPKVDGFDLLKAMADDNRLITTPVMVITVELSEDIRTCVLRLGAAAFITKPYEPTGLLSIVAATLKTHFKAMQNGSSC